MKPKTKNQKLKTITEWYKGAIIYQIYPRSFYDTSGNGTGDLRGIIEKLDYIASLGVDGIWICPFFKSPMNDFGYDVEDYRDVDPMFGTLQDFERLTEKAHSLGLKVIIDLVLSHTSIKHPWFRDNSKKEWYVWADPKNDGTPPNNWQSIFGGSAWEFDSAHGQYYMHNFLTQQPDLNYHNPEVQDEALDIARFWLEKGVEGFRLDTVNFYFHDPELRDNPPSLTGQTSTQFEGEDPYSNQQHIYDKSRPENIGFIRRFRKLLDEYGAFAVGEIGDDNPVACAVEYTGDGLLQTAYNLQMMIGQRTELTPSLIREPIETFRAHPECWPSWAFSNHDVVRSKTRWDADPKMLIAMLGTLYGTMFLYQGEELGLEEAELTFEQLRDPWGIHLWPEWQGRDGCRTPMPWNDTPANDTWLPIQNKHTAMNVDAQNNDENSVLNFTRRFLKWRKDQKPLLTGNIVFNTSEEDSGILKFTRSLNGESITCRFDLRTGAFSVQGFDQT